MGNLARNRTNKKNYRVKRIKYKRITLEPRYKIEVLSRRQYMQKQQSQEELIKKYDKTKLKNYNAFTMIPLDIFQKGLSRNAIGLYIYLSTIAGVSPYYEGKKAALMLNTQSLLRMLKWKTRRAELQSLIDELIDTKVIQIYNRVDTGREFDVIFPRIKYDKDMRFLKLYSFTLRKLMTVTSGKRLLGRFVSYAGLRTGIFENSTSSQIFEQSPSYVAQILRVNTDVVRHNFTWLRENNIIAFYKCKVSKDLGYERYYYAEYRDWKKLRDVIKGYVKQGVVKEVLA